MLLNRVMKTWSFWLVGFLLTVAMNLNLWVFVFH